MTHHAELGRCCVVWLRPQVERLVPVRATNLEFDPNDIHPTPLSVSAVEHLLRVVRDIQHASQGVNCDVSPSPKSGSASRTRPPDRSPETLGASVNEPATACPTGSDRHRSTGDDPPVTPNPN